MSVLVNGQKTYKQMEEGACTDHINSVSNMGILR